MTKKLLFGAMATAMLFATSCSNEMDVVTPTDGEATVTVGLSIPQKQMGSRSFSDGTKADKLQYAVYEKSSTGDLSLLEGMSAIETPETINIQKQLTFRLLNDHTYVFVFWAANEAAPYEVEFEENGEVTMTATYADVVANNEALDAFYTVKEIKVTGSTKMEAELYRPFAQINIGTNDLKDMANQEHAVEEVTVEVSDVYSSFDLMTGYVTGDAKSVTFASAGLPQGETFPVAGYDYLAMNYVLVGQKDDQDEAQKLVTVSFTATNEVEGETTTRRVGNVPIQRNYRTNIFGQIFTSDIDLNVTIVPDYQKPDINYDQLLLAAQVGGSVTLTDDVKVPGELVFTNDAFVDLGGHTVDAEGGNYGDTFVFKGGNIVISNGTINPSDKSSLENQSATIMVNTAKETHLTLNDVKVTGVYPIYLNSSNVNSTITINGGEFYSEYELNPAVYVGNATKNGTTGGKVIINGGTFGQSGVTYPYLLNVKDILRQQEGKEPRDFIEVFGGTFINFDPSDCISEGIPTNFVADGYKSVMTESGEDKIYTVVKEGTTVVSSSEELKDALGTLEDGSTIALVNGTELNLDDFATIKGKENITIEGNGATITIGNAQTAGFNGTTFKNVHFNGAAQNYRGLQHSSNLTFVDCTMDGLFFLYAVGEEGSVFNNCTFNQTESAYNVWTYTSTPVTFNGCTFNSTGRGINIYADGGFTQEVTFNNCKFYASAISDGKAAIEIGNFGYNNAGKITVNINNCTSEGFDLGNNSKNNLWNHKEASNGQTKIIVNVNGEKVYEV